MRASMLFGLLLAATGCDSYRDVPFEFRLKNTSNPCVSWQVEANGQPVSGRRFQALPCGESDRYLVVENIRACDRASTYPCVYSTQLTVGGKDINGSLATNPDCELQATTDRPGENRIPNLVIESRTYWSAFEQRNVTEHYCAAEGGIY